MNVNLQNIYLMKRNFLIMALTTVIAIALAACSSRSQKTSSEAKTSMEALVKELAKDPESVKLENINAVYETDSLSILHFDFTAKNGLGIESTDKMEYVYLIQGGKKYEALHELAADSVYLDNASWEKNRKGTIYENLDYDGALRYLAATFVNGNGRVVGDKSQEQEVKIDVPTKTGAWELKHYSDSFGEETNDSYLVLMGKGVFSNSATSNSELDVVFFVDKDSFSFRLFEYGSSPVKDDDAMYVTRIKDSEGNVTDYRLWNAGQSGQIGSINMANDYAKILDILNKGGEITVIMSYNDYGQSDYRFKLNVDGFNNAIKLIK